MSNTTQPRPASIQLGELAIIASAAGSAVAIYYRDFPAPVLSDMWRYHASALERASVAEIIRPWDLRRLADENLKLVLVPEPALRTAVAWKLNLHRRPDDSQGACGPALFACCSTRSPEEDPGATLVLHGHPGEYAAVVEFLRSPAALNRTTAQPCAPGDVDFRPEVEAAINKLQRYRDREVVRHLLVGAAVCRGAVDGQDLAVGVDAYNKVFNLLRQGTVRSAEEPFDPLAVAMVNRANCYLKSLCADIGEVKIARVEQANGATKDKPKHDALVTRRELVDLGNPGATLLRELIKHLLSQPDGYEAFRQLGLSVRLPHGTDWPARNEKELAKVIRPWTAKQVRIRFDRLQKEGLITAERRPANGPWFYRLPESLADWRCDFRKLPKPTELEAGPITANDQERGRPHQPDVCPPQRAATSGSDERASDESDGG